MSCNDCLRPKTHRVTDGGGSAAVCSICAKLNPVNRLLQFQVQPQLIDTCPICKTKRTGVKKTGLVGCPVCYEVFDVNIREILGQN